MQLIVCKAVVLSWFFVYSFMYLFIYYSLYISSLGAFVYLEQLWYVVTSPHGPATQRD